MAASKNHWDGIDWPQLARRFQHAQTELIHPAEGEEPNGLAGDEFVAEALRRTLDGRRLRFADIGDRSAGSGLEPLGEMNERIAVATWSANMERDRAKKENAQLLATYRSERAVLARELAAGLRAACNERSVPSRYRRDGVELAAKALERAAAHEDLHGTAKDATDEACPPESHSHDHAAWHRLKERQHVALNAAIRALAEYDAQHAPQQQVSLEGADA